jgi:hypothetical protein
MSRNGDRGRNLCARSIMTGCGGYSVPTAKSGSNNYVNIQDLKQIALINRTTKEITRWPLTVAQTAEAR